MTRDEILNMPAGREMDTLMAEKVMGLKLWHGDPAGFDFAENIDYWRADVRNSDDELCLRCPRYSTDIVAAWLVVEKFGFSIIKVDEGWMVGIFDGYCDDSNNGGCVDGYVGGDAWSTYRKIGLAPAAPLAICRASLIAVLDI